MKRMPGVLLALLVAWTALASAQGATTSPPDRARILKAAAEVMEAARYCTLITVDQEGQPEARVVDPFAPEANMVVWIATKPNTRKVAQLKNNPRASLLCYDPRQMGYVTLLGKATIVTDAAAKAAHWKPEWKMFYQDENRGADYALIRLVPARLEILSPAHGLNNNPGNWLPVILEL